MMEAFCDKLGDGFRKGIMFSYVRCHGYEHSFAEVWILGIMPYAQFSAGLEVVASEGIAQPILELLQVVLRGIW